MRPHRIAIALSAMLLTVLLGSVPTASAAPYCGITWGSLTKTVLSGTEAPITDVRTGRHDCWDRLVIDVGGTPAPGYGVGYVDSFQPFGGGSALPVTGGAV
ncbi:MAG TPA: hypothetical protein VF045_09260, partial [Acidimicrobiales bacterium]